jgi:uncharacterized protein (DUF3820 family)
MVALVDESLMPQKGKFKGYRMENVPYWYLLWLHEQDFCSQQVKSYIDRNMDTLLLEKKQNLIKT